MNSDPDSEIIQRVLGGEVESFEEIIKKYQDRVLRLCASVVGRTQAEDAAQELFLKIYESLSKFKGESLFSTWLYRITTNHCLNILKKTKRDKLQATEAESLKESVPSISEVQGKKEMLHVILSRLDPQEWAILMLREVEGFSYKEIAETLQISLDLVKVRLFRARQSLIQNAKDFL